MARRSRATGVGKGNGPGSRKGQYKDGMPSGNPLGRPKKEKETPPGSIREAIARGFLTEVPITENGVERGKSPQGVAMIKMLFANYPRASVNEKLRILTWLMTAAPDAFLERTFQPPVDVVNTVLLRLKKEYEDEHGIVSSAPPAEWPIRPA